MTTLEDERRIVELLHYDPDTGIFTWKKSPTRQKRHMVGNQAGSVDKVNGYNRITIAGRCYLCHRLAVFFMTGKWPETDEVVHHKNEKKSDNELLNLEVKTRFEHNREHRTGRRMSEETLAKMRVVGLAITQTGAFNGPLSAETIRAIRADPLGPSSASRKYGVHKSTVIDIRKGRRYAHIA